MLRIYLTALSVVSQMLLMCCPVLANTPPPLRFQATRSYSIAAGKTRALEIIRADDSISRGTETRDSAAYIETSRICQVIVDIWSMGNADAIVTVNGSPIWTVDQFDWFPEANPISVKGPGSPSKFTQKTVVVSSRHNYTSISFHPLSQANHGPVHVFVTGLYCGARF